MDAVPNRHPRVDLGFFPTPVHRLTRLGLDADVWIKRDDQTGLATGGNKVRKLEYLLADALARKATTVVTGGGLQSNFARQTAAACALLGLSCVLGVRPGYLDTPDFTDGGNVLLDRLLGADVRVYPVPTTPAAIDAAAAELAAQGRAAYPIPMGGSNALGSLGYVRAVDELAAQWKGEPPDAIVVPASSCGTAAGLIAGVAAHGWPTRVWGVCVDEPAAATRRTIDALLDGLRGLGVDVGADVAYETPEGYLGDGYGVPTDGMREAVSLLARTQGILLDPVYSGKAFAGLLGEARHGGLRDARRILFWHTGGTPALFAYRGELLVSDAEGPGGPGRVSR